MERREQMNSKTSLQTLSLAELALVTGGALILQDDGNDNGKGNGNNDTSSEHDGSPEPGSGDRDIGSM